MKETASKKDVPLSGHVAALAARLKASEDHAVTTRQIARLARQKLKLARRTHKHARKIARRARKTAAKLRRRLARAMKKSSPAKIKSHKATASGNKKAVMPAFPDLAPVAGFSDRAGRFT